MNMKIWDCYCPVFVLWIEFLTRDGVVTVRHALFMN